MARSGRSSCTLPIATMRPKPRASMPGRKAWIRRTVACRLTSLCNARAASLIRSQPSGISTEAHRPGCRAPARSPPASLGRRGIGEVVNQAAGLEPRAPSPATARSVPRGRGRAGSRGAALGQCGGDRMPDARRRARHQGDASLQNGHRLSRAAAARASPRPPSRLRRLHAEHRRLRLLDEDVVGAGLLVEGRQVDAAASAPSPRRPRRAAPPSAWDPHRSRCASGRCR